MAHQQKLKDQTRNLAQFTSQLAKDTQAELNKLHRLMQVKDEVVAAIVRLLGEDAVQNCIDEMRTEAAAARLQAQQDGVKLMVEKKVLVPADVVLDPTGYIVGMDKLADGSEHRVQFEVAGLNPEFRPLYVGKKVGDVVQGAEGTTLTITEVYTVDVEVAKTLMQSQQPATDAAPAVEAPKADSTTEATPATQGEDPNAK